MKKIYIANTDAYYGGTLVLSVLCKTLRELGYDSRLLMTPFFPKQKISRVRFICNCLFKNFKRRYYFAIKNYKSILLSKVKGQSKNQLSASILDIGGLKVQWHPFINKNKSIVIYPELLYGNPFGAKYVARWLLYHYNYKNDPNAYSKEDLFFAYRECFNDIDLNPDNNIITIQYVDNKLYKQYNFGERYGNCYIIQKGKDRTDLPKEFDGPVLNYNMTQEEIVHMFNNYKYCYCYDVQTYYLKIAAICGCIPILVMEKGKTEKDYLSSNESHFGIAYGDTIEQIQYAINTREKCIKSIDYSEANMIHTKKLISILENQWG